MLKKIHCPGDWSILLVDVIAAFVLRHFADVGVYRWAEGHLDDLEYCAVAVFRGEVDAQGCPDGPHFPGHISQRDVGFQLGRKPRRGDVADRIVAFGALISWAFVTAIPTSTCEMEAASMAARTSLSFCL